MESFRGMVLLRTSLGWSLRLTPCSLFGTQLAQLPSAPVSMESYSWHSSLSSFSHPSVLSADGEDEPMEEPDLEVVSGMISTVVLPKVEKFARQVYDPLSRTQTRRALGVVEEVGFGVERGSAKFQVSVSYDFLAPDESLISCNAVPRPRFSISFPSLHRPRSKHDLTTRLEHLFTSNIPVSRIDSFKVEVHTPTDTAARERSQVEEPGQGGQRRWIEMDRLARERGRRKNLDTSCGG